MDFLMDFLGAGVKTRGAVGRAHLTGLRVYVREVKAQEVLSREDRNASMLVEDQKVTVSRYDALRVRRKGTAQEDLVIRVGGYHHRGGKLSFGVLEEGHEFHHVFSDVCQGKAEPVGSSLELRAGQDAEEFLDDGWGCARLDPMFLDQPKDFPRCAGPKETRDPNVGIDDDPHGLGAAFLAPVLVDLLGDFFRGHRLLVRGLGDQVRQAGSRDALEVDGVAFRPDEKAIRRTKAVRDVAGQGQLSVRGQFSDVGHIDAPREKERKPLTPSVPERGGSCNRGVLRR